MNQLVQYILSVTAAAIVLAILRSLAGEGSMGTLVRFIGGVFMALTVISPLIKLELPDVEAWFSRYGIRGDAAAAAGAEMADEASLTIIKAQVEAYIMDKAACYDASPTVEVELNDEGLPCAVTLTGDILPYARVRLAQILEEDLGLGEEAQHWIS